MKKQSIKPGFERLEDRLTPTSGITATLTNGILDIVGTDKGDKILVQLKNDKIEIGGVKIKVGNKSESAVAANKINLIRINGRGGDDTISLAPGKNAQPITINQEIFGGEGKDTSTSGDGVSDVFGDGGDDTLQAANGQAFMYGGAGNDTLRGGTGYNAFTGNEGDDTFVGGANFDAIYETGDVNFFLGSYTLQGLGRDLFFSIETAYLTQFAFGSARGWRPT